MTKPFCLKVVALLSISLLSCIGMNAQQMAMKIRGYVTDANGSPLEAVTASLLKDADSIIFKLSATNKEGQFQFMKDLTQQIISGGGSGIMYWEPAWITSRLNDSWGTGSSWDNVTLFDFTGNVLKGADYMSSPYKF